MATLALTTQFRSNSGGTVISTAGPVDTDESSYEQAYTLALQLKALLVLALAPAGGWEDTATYDLYLTITSSAIGVSPLSRSVKLPFADGTYNTPVSAICAAKVALSHVAPDSD